MGGHIDFKELEKCNAFSILILLSQTGRCKKTTLYESHNSGKLPEKIAKLVELGLIFEDKRNQNNTKYVELTPLGYQVVQKIWEIESLITAGDDSNTSYADAGDVEGSAAGGGAPSTDDWIRAHIEGFCGSDTEDAITMHLRRKGVI